MKSQIVELKKNIELLEKGSYGKSEDVLLSDEPSFKKKKYR